MFVGQLFNKQQTYNYFQTKKIYIYTYVYIYTISILAERKIAVHKIIG